jgi:uncharacterized protein YjaZ
MQWLHLDKTYRRMIAAESHEAREAIYRAEIIEPLRGTLDMAMRWNPSAAQEDDLERARSMMWLMPEDFETEPAGLALLDAVNAWERGEEALRRSIERFLPYQDRIAVETEVTGTIMLVKPFPMIDFSGGYAGYQMEGYTIVTYDRPDESNVHKAWGAAAHEYNHRIRLTAFPWDMSATNVGEYCVMEGLAESFAVDLYGEDVLGYYVTGAQGADLDKARALIRENWRETGFDTLRAHIFGDRMAQAMGFDQGLGMPDFGGYAVGYHLVQAYLKQSGASIEEATLTPVEQIIEESGYLV